MRVFFTNPNDHPIYIGGIKVYAGETRSVNAANLPGPTAPTGPER